MKRKSPERSDREWPSFPLGPILEHYDGDPVHEGTGWRPYKCINPDHQDKNKSASVSMFEGEGNGVFNCHGCGLKGNAVQLIMRMENKPYGDALRAAKEITGESHPSVHAEHRRGRRVSSRSGNQSGSRALKRTWSRD